MENQKVLGEFSDPTTPGSSRPTAAIPLLARKTIAQIAEAMNAEIAKGAALQSIAGVDVDEAIARKTVCLFGENYLSPEQLLKAVANVYDLRVARDAKGRVRIATQRPRLLRSGSEIPGEILRLLPTSYVRAAMTSETLSGSPLTGKGQSPATDALYIASIKRLREIIEPMLNKPQVMSLSLSDVPVEAGDLIGLSSLATCLMPLRNLAQPKPSYLDYLDKATLCITVEGNRAIYRVTADTGNGRPEGVQGSVRLNGLQDPLEIPLR